jgi:hypothetical protein
VIAGLSTPRPKGGSHIPELAAVVWVVTLYICPTNLIDCINGNTVCEVMHRSSIGSADHKPEFVQRVPTRNARARSSTKTRETEQGTSAVRAPTSYRNWLLMRLAP